MPTPNITQVSSSPVRLRRRPERPSTLRSESGAAMVMLEAMAPVAKAAAIAAAQVALAKFALAMKDYLCGPDGENLAAILLAHRSAGFKTKFADMVSEMGKDPLMAEQFSTLLTKLERISEKADYAKQP